MKKLIFLSACSLLWLLACNEQPKTQTAPKNEPTAAETQQPAPEPEYACPMHPEITGKSGDKCSKCGMDLKPVKK